MLATLKDIVKRFDNITALDHVSFDIYKGEILGLLGPNGAGKTTLIKALAGLSSVDSGQIILFDERQHPNHMALKQNIGLVTQEITIFEELTASENLKFFGGLYGLKGETLNKSVGETLAFVGLAEHANQYPKKFSGGMARRLNIACALVHKPQFIIMDEPTVGIDPQSRSYILESVKRLATQGSTVLYTSHYMEEVQAISSRIVIMDQGHVIAQGTLEELTNRIQYEEKITITVVTPSEDLLNSFKAVQGVKRVMQHEQDYTIISSAGSGNLNRILAIAQNNGGVLNINAAKPTLEDVFLTLTGKHLRDNEED